MKKKPSPPGVRFLDICLHRLGAWYTEDGLIPPPVIEHHIKRAIGVLFRDGPIDQRERFQRMEERAAGCQFFNWDHEAYLWRSSFFSWGRYLEEGEPLLFAVLPHRLADDANFFLLQWWIARIFAEWIEGGEKKKITEAMFGPHKSWQRDLKTVSAKARRDLEISDRMNDLGIRGYGYNKAVTQVHKEIMAHPQRLDIGGEHLSPSAIKKIFTEYMRKAKNLYNPFQKRKDEKKKARAIREA